MNVHNAKRLSIAGAGAIVAALILGAMPWDFIAPAPIIVLVLLLLVAGVLAVVIGSAWLITQAIRGSRA